VKRIFKITADGFVERDRLRSDQNTESVVVRSQYMSMIANHPRTGGLVPFGTCVLRCVKSTAA